MMALTPHRRPRLVGYGFAVCVLVLLNIVNQNQNQNQRSRTLQHYNDIAVPAESSREEEVVAVDLAVENQQPCIYVCEDGGNGIQEALSVFSDVLPEYKVVDWQSIGTGKRPGLDYKRIQETPGNPYDLFVMSQGRMCSSVVHKWLEQHFQGKLVYISGEDSRLPLLRDFSYLLGPAPKEARKKESHILQIYYLQLVYWFYFRSKSRDEMIWNHTLKTKNTGKHFLIYGNSNCVRFRQEAFDELSKINPAHSGGKCNGLTPSNGNKTSINTGVSLRNWADNVNVYHEYRFCLVMEHSKVDGYITEKILMAFAAGCIPIYYGTEEIFKIFNREAFIYYDIDNPTPALHRVAYLEQNRTAYESLLTAQPILARGNQTLEDFFSFSQDFGHGMLKQRILKTLGLEQFRFINGSATARS